ncbi:unnamed protein product [Hermetia illucens]|uniref:RETREG1-3/ARL6IP-like N-terminal reticulon-homology domain-containing protein n=1 Tax=Hermetia illucens TaxID=343691 RepID=A0A7R8V1L0_HERIL|nr:ADP-ribosylation factor-like protein 6-interacting protein 1 [Hermetia illucens]CAD7091121.1 unnamed protein product [Hermetia illucens]
MTSVDQKKMFNKLKHDLESWREVILHTNSLLKWDKKFYPGIIFAVISIFYLLLWYLDLSTLTLISLSLLVVTIIDYVFPLVSRIVFKTENWTGTQENKFEEICQELCATKIKLCSFYNYIFTAKEEKSTMFLISVSLILVLLAWIGSVIDNLFLCFITTLFAALYPGLSHHGFIGTVKGKFGAVLSSKIQQIKEKASKTE